MYTFVLQLQDLFENGVVGSFLVFFVFVWAVWLFKVRSARGYEPWREPYDAKVSVIVPVVDEPHRIFRTVLVRIKENGVDQTLVVINGPRNRVIENICIEQEVPWVWTKTPGKRNAIAVGLQHIENDITVLLDSDSILESDTIAELVKPFADSKIGGVTTKQLIIGEDRNYITRFAAWMERARSHWSMPAMSNWGTVGCLPGRAIAFRTSILRDSIDDFLTDEFLGTHLEVSDDRSLTNYALRSGYKTVFQDTAIVHTDCPLAFKKFVKQQYRWARGSQYNTLRMTGWMLKNARGLALLYWTEVLLPFWLFALFTFSAVRYVNGDYGFGWNLISHIFLVALGATLSLSLRQVWVYKNKQRALYLPIVLILTTFVMLPIRIAGFVRCAYDDGWGTRANAFQGTTDRSWKRFIPAALALAFYGAFMLIVGLLGMLRL